MRLRVTLPVVLCALASFAAEPVIDFVGVKTKAPENPLVRFWYRVPRGYDPNGKGLSRVLILFGGRNCDGRPEVSGKLGWTEWADLNGIFLVAPTLKNDNYWEPEKWSGRALLDALAAISAKYWIKSSGLLYYGYSAGSQASNLFAAWRPDLCRAYVSHACGVFHAPALRMKSVAGLVTCGDADTARYVIGRNFVDQYRRLGIPIIWKSFPNHPHDVPPGSIALAQAFFAHYHWEHRTDLGLNHEAGGRETFVGDDADGLYYRTGSGGAQDVMPDDRVPLPSAAIARAWGRPGRTEGFVQKGMTLSDTDINGVDVVFAVPRVVCADSRVLILVGGRGWSGEKAIRELGFEKWAEESNWCIISPSFANGEYWEPESGSAEVLRLALDALRKKHGLRPLPVFLFGYSAGGQLVALLQNTDRVNVCGWAVYGCGVFPEVPKAHVPAFVACGVEDSDRLRISRDFVYRYREAGGQMLWKPVRAGHELNAAALDLARSFFAAVAEGRPSSLWGEDDIRQVRPYEQIDEEFRNPLYNRRIAVRWMK